MSDRTNCALRNDYPIIETGKTRGYRILICASCEHSAYEIHLALAGISHLTSYITLVTNSRDVETALNEDDYDLIICGDAGNSSDMNLVEAVNRYSSGKGHKKVFQASACNLGPDVKTALSELPIGAGLVMNACGLDRCMMSGTMQFDSSDISLDIVDNISRCPLRR